MADKKVVAIDIGGTAIKSGMWNGRTLEEIKETETLAAQGGEALMERVKGIISSYGEGFDAIGISTAGEVNTNDGSIYYANSNIPGYTGMPVKKIMEETFHVPTAVENDVNAAALGELRAGAAKGCNDFLCLTYGTGVGGSIVIDRKVYQGASFSAGSFGGIVIHPEEKKGTDSLEGCYERCASTTGLVKRAKTVDASLDNGKKIFAAKDRPEVKVQIDAWIDDICTGLVTLTTIFNPSRIILGGGVMAQEYVLSEVNRRVKEQIAPGLRKVEIVPAKLANTAGMIGAVSLAEKLLA